jgi:hypothetical protein
VGWWCLLGAALPQISGENQSTIPVVRDSEYFMYRRHILCTLHMAVDFQIVLCKGLYGGWGGGLLEGVGPEKIETFLGPEMATSETHVHKITNVPVSVFLYGTET